MIWFDFGQLRSLYNFSANLVEDIQLKIDFAVLSKIFGVLQSAGIKKNIGNFINFAMSSTNGSLGHETDAELAEAESDREW